MCCRITTLGAKSLLFTSPDGAEARTKTSIVASPAANVASRVVDGDEKDRPGGDPALAEKRNQPEKIDAADGAVVEHVVQDEVQPDQRVDRAENPQAVGQKPSQTKLPSAVPCQRTGIVFDTAPQHGMSSAKYRIHHSDSFAFPP